MAERRGIESNGAYDEIALLRDGTPGRDVPVMVELRDDDLVSLAPSARETAREVKGDGRHVVAERDVGGRRIEERSKRRPCLIQQPIRLGARGLGPAGFGVVLKQVVRHP